MAFAKWDFVIWQPFNRRGWLRAFLLGLIFWFSPFFGEAATLVWDRNSETNIVGYRVHIGRLSRVYDSVLDIGNLTVANVPTTPGITYYAVTAYDSDGLESAFSSEVTFTDGSVNFPPAPVADSYNAIKNTTLSVSPSTGVLANDSDANGQSLTAALVTGPAHGTLTLNSDGSFIYTPAAEYAGPDSFTYQCSDGTAVSDATTVSISVGLPPPVNIAPVAQNDAYSTPKDTALQIAAGSGLLANDSDANSDAIAIAWSTTPNQGSLALNANGSFTYTPAANYTGTDSFLYKISDGIAESIVATVTITVTTPQTANTPPVPGNDNYSVGKNSFLSVGVPGVLNNDSDADGNPLTASLVNAPNHGVVTLNANGSFLYTPLTGYVGPDSFTYRAHDGTTNALATVSINVSGTPITNSPPVPQADSYVTAKNTPLSVSPAAGVLANDSDPDGTPLSVVQYGSPTKGTVNLYSDGSFTYVPSANVTGTDTFGYRALDGQAISGPVTVTITITGAPPANTTPVAVADTFSTTKNVALNVSAPGVLGNDTDADGNALTAVLVAGPAHGSLTLNANGGFSFTPATGYVGADSFTYRANDGTANSPVVTVSLTINAPPNSAPVAVADSYSTLKNTTLNVTAGSGLLVNDTDSDGNALTAVLVSSPTHGTVSLNANGSFTFVPAAGYVGADGFTYRANDGTADSPVVAVTLAINAPPNSAPLAQADTYATTRNVTLAVGSGSGVLANDSDADDNALTAVLVSSPAHGNLTLSANGGFTFVPAANYVGPDSFSYRANDGSTNSAVATVTLTINPPPNTAPVAVSDNYATTRNAVLSVGAPGVLANDSDADANALTAMLVNSPAHGTLVLNANGGFSFTPTTGYVGPDSFTYRANDGTTNSALTTVTLTINPPPNTPPVAQADNYSTTKNIALTVNAASGLLANDSDADGNALAVVLVSSPAHGSLAVNANGSFTFAPAANYVGPDSFTYRANDGTTNSAITTVIITIQPPPNTAPVAQADSYATTKNVALTINAALGLLANDSDPDGNPLSAILVAAPSHGTLTLNANGSFTFIPTSEYTGADGFTYRASDGATNSAATSVTLTISPTPNSAPVAVGDSYVTTKNSSLTVTAAGGLLANDSDADGNALTAILLSSPAHGTLTLNPNGGFTYVPAVNYVGSDSFSYRVNDGTADSGNATVSLTINPPPNSAPVAQGDDYSTTRNVALTVNAASGLLANDADLDGNALAAVLVNPPAHGSLALNADGSFTFTPTAGYVGPDNFSYRVNDGVTNSASAIVTLTIHPPPNSAPVAQPDSYSTLKNTPVVKVASVGVLANDTDADANALTAALVGPPSFGSVVLNSDGSFTYAPSNNYVGPDSFAYRAHDGTTNSPAVTVTISINAPPNTAPVARGENYSVTKNAALTVAAPGVLANDTDADGNVLAAVVAGAPAHGTVVLNANGSFTYTPIANYVGSDSFSYRAHDGTANSAAATVFITVTPPPNTAPVAISDNYSTVKNTPLVIAAFLGLLANDSDTDGDALTASLASPPSQGTLVLVPGGSFSYTPAAGFTGTDTFTYRANDGAANSAVAVVTITVTEPPLVNVPPVANVDRYFGIKNEPMEIPAHSGVLVNDTDANGDSLEAVLVATPNHGALTFHANGSFSYTPELNFTGVDSFGYYATDGTNTTPTTMVTITVNEPLPQNAAPVALPENYSALKNTPLYVSWINGVLVNDTDADGDSLMAALVTAPAHGTVTLNWNGGFIYVPAAGFLGTDQFSYESDDGLDVSGSTVVTISVSEPTRTNGAPVARADVYFTTRNTPIEMPATSGLLINDNDADGEPLTAALVFPPSHGTVTLNLDGSFTYTPAAEFSGNDTFAYDVSDGVDSSAPTLVTISIADTAPNVGGCPTCFAALDELMADRSAVFASAISARSAVPTNATCPQYDVLVFRTLTRVLGPLHDSAANKALARAGNCVATELENDLAPRLARAASLAPSKYTTLASNYFKSIAQSLVNVPASTNNSTRSKWLAAAGNAFVRADKALAAGDLARASLNGHILNCTFVRGGQSSRGIFVFGANTFVVEDSTGTPIRTGSYTYQRTDWNAGVLNLVFDQPTLGYQAGAVATWNFKYTRTRHKISAPGLRGYFTLQ